VALRLIEVFLPKDKEELAKDILKDKVDFGIWIEEITESHILARILVYTEKTEEILDLLDKTFSTAEGFRIMILPVEATLPRPEQPKGEGEAGAEQKKEEEDEKKKNKERISSEELYQDIGQTIKVSWVFILLLVLSSVVAAIGIERNNVAIIIGAMVIAPLLGPNVALSLSTTLGDMDLARRAFKASIIGIGVVLAVAVLLGLFLGLTPDVPEVKTRTTVGLEDIVLALAAGSAGTLSFTAGLSTAIIGVMVAVSLLPPLVTSGMLLGGGFGDEGGRAFLLFLTNVVCINLAGIVTFVMQGIRPRTWWEADKARKGTRNAIILWTILLLILIVSIFLTRAR
jgi:uncharacterized hydrophobic protein (TIGR00341 family)